MAAPRRDNSAGSVHRGSAVPLAAAAFILIFYAGAYYALARPMVVTISPSASPPFGRFGWSVMVVTYDPLPAWLNPSAASMLFGPIHAVDRRLRPDYWNSSPLREAIPVAPPPLTLPGFPGPSAAP